MSIREQYLQGLYIIPIHIALSPLVANDICRSDVKGAWSACILVEESVVGARNIVGRTVILS